MGLQNRNCVSGVWGYTPRKIFVILLALKQWCREGYLVVGLGWGGGGLSFSSVGKIYRTQISEKNCLWMHSLLQKVQWETTIWRILQVELKDKD